MRGKCSNGMSYLTYDKAKALTTAIKRSGLRQKQFCDKVGISYSKFRAIVTGTNLVRNTEYDKWMKDVEGNVFGGDNKVRLTYEQASILRLAIKGTGMTQNEFFDKLNIRAPFLFNVLHGINLISLKEYNRILALAKDMYQVKVKFEKTKDAPHDSFALCKKCGWSHLTKNVISTSDKAALEHYKETGHSVLIESIYKTYLHSSK